MSAIQRFRIAALGAALALAALAPAAQAGVSNTPADFGQPAAPAAAARTITITPTTKSVTVENGETVQFVVNGKTFAWHFDTYNRDTNFDLARIAPRDVNVPKVHVYLTPDATYRGF